ncbi:MAG: peptidoglycan-binding protein [Lachnospiraceae bacterium]|nr:peptidoglycan-binding protein [Lachnospiraceae bacterium]
MTERYKRLTGAVRRYGIAVLAAGLLAGCGAAAQSANATEATTEEIVLMEETLPQTAADETVMALSPDGPILPSVAGVDAEYSEPIPDYLRVGEQHPIVVKLQERLMELGFMDNDEPTDYYGEVTQSAVKIYQRQNQLAQDGVIGPETLKAILSPDAKYYAAQPGDQGDDIQRIQIRLYELGYLASEGQLTGSFGESTEEAVKKMQSVNALEQDGKVGRKTMNLLYSEDVKPNMLSYGEKSEVVLAAQKRLKELGYMTTDPDGSYGNDTIIAVKQFQSKNDQVVDGYLGPSTRIALNSGDALPNGLSLGDSGDNIQRVQNLLSKLGYLTAANATGYYGEVTENAVKLFQRTNGLSSDGQVGAMTMAKLTSTDAKKAPANTPRNNNNSSNRGSSGSSSGQSSSGGSSSGGKQSGGSTSVPNTGSASGGASALISVASSKLGSPYVWGAKGPNSFDCSGFVYWCLNQVGVRQSYITSSGWRSVGKYTRISSFSNLRAGDIIVVSGHVGIVAGGGTVIDASSGNGKVVHRSLSSWWANNFIVGWRIFG